MKKTKLEKKFLKELRRVPNVSLACENVRISRNTIYRWRIEHSAFKTKMDKALLSGVDSINDLAESKLVSHINNGNMRAIKYWLDNNKKNYVKPRPKVEQQTFSPVTKIEIVAPEGYTVKDNDKLKK